MIDYDTLGQEVKDALHQRGHTRETIEQMGIAEAFDEYCCWHGLIGWSNKLRRILFDIGSSSDYCLRTTDQSKEDWVMRAHFDL